MDQIEIMRRDSDPVMREFNAMVRQIERGDPFHPQEVQDLIDQLMEEGYHFEAQRLAGMKINWDR